MKSTLAAVALTLLGVPAFAQSAMQRIELQKIEFPPEKWATMIYVVIVPPGGNVPPHTHPGVEMGYVEEGEAILSIDGQPDIPLKPGASYKVPPGARHSARNVGAGQNKIIATFAVEKDKPLATPAP